MTRRALRIAVGLSLWSAVIAGSQSPVSAVLSDALRARLRDGRFDAVTSVRGLPLGVRGHLEAMFGGTLDIAEPGAAFRTASQAANRQVPTRRLVAAGCSSDSYCVVYYERGGGEHTWRVLVFHWTPAVTRFEWGGTAPGGFATIDAVRKGILSGAIKGGQTTAW